MSRRRTSFRFMPVVHILNLWPGKSRFGLYRFLPIFFILGAALEFSMINWRVGQVNFYNTYKKRIAHERTLSKGEPVKATIVTT